ASKFWLIDHIRLPNCERPHIVPQGETISFVPLKAEEKLMKSRNLMCAVICFGTLLTTGCASITRGTKDVFSIQTDPPGATASMSNGLTCVTPCTLELPRKHGFTVTLTLDGYKSLSTSIVPRQAGAGSAGMAGNVIFGGLIGAAVDASSGAMKDLYPNPLIVRMVPLGSDQSSTVELPGNDVSSATPQAPAPSETGDVAAREADTVPES